LRIENPRVGGSIPPLATIFPLCFNELPFSRSFALVKRSYSAFVALHFVTVNIVSNSKFHVRKHNGREAN
jgi:hypothetical protein